MNTPPPASDRGVSTRRKVDLQRVNKDLLEDIPDNSNANQDSQPQLLQSQSSQNLFVDFTDERDLLSSYTKKKHSMRPKIPSPMKDPSKDGQPNNAGAGSVRASNPSMPSHSSPHNPVHSFRSGRRDVDPNLLQLTDRTSGSQMVSGGSSHVKSNVSPPTITIGKSANKRKEGGSPSQKSKKKKTKPVHLNKKFNVNDLAHMDLTYPDGIDQEHNRYFDQYKLQLTNKTNTLSARDQETLMMQKKASQNEINDPHSGREAVSPVTPQTQLMEYQSKSPTEACVSPFKPQHMIESLHENEDAQTSPLESAAENTRGAERKVVLQTSVEKSSAQPAVQLMQNPSINPNVQIMVSSTVQHSARANNSPKKPLPPPKIALQQRRFEIIAAHTVKDPPALQNNRVLRGQQKKRI